MNVLVIDIGGTHVKVWGGDRRKPVKIPSGPDFTPRKLFQELEQVIGRWSYDAVSIGYPGKLVHGKPVRDALNLGPGWVDFDFAAHFDKPLRIMNDAAMQALGSYEGGRMLFLGLGTSVGSALVVDNVIVPLELGNIAHSFGETLEHHLAREAIAEKGVKRWRKAVLHALPRLKDAFMADYMVLGGGNVKKLIHKLPPGVRRGNNRHARLGGHRLWESHDLCTAQVFDASARRGVAV